MLSNDKINQLLNITESYQAPSKTLEVMLSDSKNDLFNKFLEIEPNLSYEWFQGYFETEHADRKVKKQDFTPNSVSKLMSLLVGKRDTYFEAAAGTGGIAIQFWNENPDAWFRLEELSDRSVPFLIFNMAIRGANGVVLHGDSLDRNFKGMYYIKRNGQFSDIIVANKEEGDHGPKEKEPL